MTEINTNEFSYKEALMRLFAKQLVSTSRINLTTIEANGLNFLFEKFKASVFTSDILEMERLIIQIQEFTVVDDV